MRVDIWKTFLSRLCKVNKDKIIHRNSHVIFPFLDILSQDLIKVLTIVEKQ